MSQQVVWQGWAMVASRLACARVPRSSLPLPLPLSQAGAGAQQADGQQPGEQQAAAPALPAFAYEHLEAGWENRALEELLGKQQDYLVAFLGDSITAQLACAPFQPCV